MTKLLVVKAHPLTAKESRSVFVAGEFLTSYRQANPQDEIEELSLYSDSIPLVDKDILTAFSALAQGTLFTELSTAQQAKLARFDELTAQFMTADKVVIVNPMWNLSIPPMLKAWFDTIMVVGKTFKYTATGSVGLLANKPILHIQANGGTYKGEDFGAKYVHLAMSFMGITDVQDLFVEGMDHNPELAEEIVAEAVKKAQELGKTF
ncbi:FMN-dependent NADH-azoreductase [Enterococcus hermanniensis]|uniref:FMN dependent NADH:quinone oxidoreductase n=1 Tax=Enterococcus hermanniensis TaxID=249189 RepID=A0A1L8TMW5_9ENTE|nr:NAD(P)H-dependent oxidoreductase [Enterococcus hermanniensis]OJG45659.1 FMN-dependent NADH-azoreductase [Enterococcus hermanniensis]